MLEQPEGDFAGNTSCGDNIEHCSQYVGIGYDTEINKTFLLPSPSLPFCERDSRVEEYKAEEVSPHYRDQLRLLTGMFSFRRNNRSRISKQTSLPGTSGANRVLLIRKIMMTTFQKYSTRCWLLGTCFLTPK